jgi:cytochrome c553
MIRVPAFARRHPWVALVTAGGGLAAVVFAVVSTGIVPITASSGHWAITEWFLHFAMRRSVVTHALKVDSPPDALDSDANVLIGAGHYETGCRSCHGAPGEPLPAVPAAMTPHPPALVPRIPTWNARQLFYIVKHGVKFTGMPAWPAQSRDDEVWSMVAFLRRMPALSAADYERLVWGAENGVGDADAVPAVAEGEGPSPPEMVEVCARCHGRNGQGRGTGAFPMLAGQRLDYMARAMHAYADGRRRSGVMEPLAQRHRGAALQETLRYYALQSRPQPTAQVDPAAVQRGETLAHRGSPRQEIPSCASCHEVEPVNDAFPRLHGQPAWYLARQLRLLQRRDRGGSEYVELMHSFVSRLTEEQIEDAAAYYAATAEHKP